MIRLRRLLGGAALAAALVPAGASASTITVNGTGNNQAEDGICTLREAITSANTNTESGNGTGGIPECVAGQAAPTQDTIAFTASIGTMTPTSPLPAVTETAKIDGTTAAPGELVLDGNAAGPGAVGLTVTGSDVTIDTVTVVRFGRGIDLTGSDDALVRNSSIGTNQAGAAALGNTVNGIVVGLDDTGATDATIRNNLISGNGSSGILCASDATSGVTIAGNRIGTGPGGGTSLPNTLSGIEILGGADDMTIGGPNVLDGNLISGNGNFGIRYFQPETDRATGQLIQGNRIGTKLGGEEELPNQIGGMGLEGAIDSAEIRGNLISGNNSVGLRIEDSGTQPIGAAGPTGTTVAGNLIGTDKDGEAALGNDFGAVLVSGANRTLQGTVIGGSTGLTPGGACTGDCNVISGTGGGPAIDLREDVDTQILGNHLGPDKAGITDLGSTNSWGIVSEDSTGAQIGAQAAGNAISGNALDGIAIGGAPAAQNEIQANTIGLGSDGSTPMGNGQNGIALSNSANDNLVGGTGAGEGNVIAENVLDGVTVSTSATDNPILGNSIHDNGGLGIDLGPNGVTANDFQDPDSGENGLQNFPVLSAAVADTETAVGGSLNSTPLTDFRIEVFGMDAEDVSLHGEGDELLGAFDVTTDAGGNTPFSAVLAGVAQPGSPVSATATELSDQGEPLSTSEFSLNADEGCDVSGTPGDDPGLTGTPAGEIICGLDGDDVIDGDGGSDFIVGGDGTDEVDYSLATGEIEADLVTGLITGAGAGSDGVALIEDVKGTDFDDILLGDGLDNTLTGKDGGDTLKGGDGADTLKSQDGGDTLRGQSGNNDDLSGGDGKDNLNGGGGSGDDCNGGGNKDDTPARGCESISSIP